MVLIKIMMLPWTLHQQILSNPFAGCDLPLLTSPRRRRRSNFHHASDSRLRIINSTQQPCYSNGKAHYHGDHYGSLPRANRYQGPAMIHCTTLTAALLKTIHEVPSNFIVPHEYGETFTISQCGKVDSADASNTAKTNVAAGDVHITFYDANHCPGAAIVLIDSSDNSITHLHCGDMRYHPKMKSYPLLRAAIQERRLGTLYLDSTYGHPKHDFCAQPEAIESIASECARLLAETKPSPNADATPPKTLIMLSCYSIGKEKVLWEASKQTNQKIYVTQKKWNMLECVQDHSRDELSQILSRCTLDASQSDIHTIPMGLAGEIWPFFRPNFIKCADYARKLDTRYDRVVAFLPTGWANASNYNRKNAICKKRVTHDMLSQCADGEDEEADAETDTDTDTGIDIDIEVRLISYSEHSAFPELVDFVQYCSPQRVVPTVFSDDNDYRKILEHFKKYVDSTRAKQSFIRSMFKTSSSLASKRESDVVAVTMARSESIHSNEDRELTKRAAPSRGSFDGDTAPKHSARSSLNAIGSAANDVVDLVTAAQQLEPAKKKRSARYENEIKALVGMGFPPFAVERIVMQENGSVERSLGRLLAQNEGTESCAWHTITDNHSTRNQRPDRSANEATAKSSRATKAKGNRSTTKSLITGYFGRKTH